MGTLIRRVSGAAAIGYGVNICELVPPGQIRAGGVTDGPYAETVEQLTGFYTVETDDLDDLLQVVAVLAGAEGAIEVRATVDHG